jgi:hypothetical protein
MEDHLQNIRNEHPDLNPTDIYGLLSKALTPDVAEQENEFETFINAIEQYEERLQGQLSALADKLKPESAEDILEQAFDSWFDDLKCDHEDIDTMFEEARDLAEAFLDKDNIAIKVNEKIIEDYPEFHAEYLQHQQWLKANEERLAQQEQRTQQDESEQSHTQDGHVR